VTFFSNDTRKVPILSKVGDIIRIHRTSLGMFKEQKQFNVNMYGRSSWVLFSGLYDENVAIEDEEDGVMLDEGEIERRREAAKYTPYASSDSGYSFHESEKAILDNLRKWAANYYKQNHVYDYETYIPAINQMNGF